MPPLAIAPSIQPHSQGETSDPAKARRPTGRSSASNVPSVNQPTGGANQVPLANGSAHQSWLALTTSSAAGANARIAAIAAAGSFGSNGDSAPKPTISWPPGTSAMARSAWSGVPQPTPASRRGTPLAIAMSFVERPG